MCYKLFSLFFIFMYLWLFSLLQVELWHYMHSFAEMQNSLYYLIIKQQMRSFLSITNRVTQIEICLPLPSKDLLRNIKKQKPVCCLLLYLVLAWWLVLVSSHLQFLVKALSFTACLCVLSFWIFHLSFYWLFWSSLHVYVYLLLYTSANRYLILAVLSSIEGLKVRATNMPNSEYKSLKM